MPVYCLLKYLHLFTVFVSISLFILRFFWLLCRSPMMRKPWVRFVPHVNDSLLLVTGIAMIMMFKLYPLLSRDSWLSEKLLGVVVYILLGHIALGARTKNWGIRTLAYIMALGCLYLIMTLATAKIPFLIGYL